MAKAGMRDAKVVGVTEVLAAEVEGQGGKKGEEDVELEEKERENAWVRVCLREALGKLSPRFDRVRRFVVFARS